MFFIEQRAEGSSMSLLVDGQTPWEGAPKILLHKSQNSTPTQD
jgi:hypothetical protein